MYSRVGVQNRDEQIQVLQAAAGTVKNCTR
jgi:hypothetical protein